MDAWVTGACGFIGRSLCRYLHAQGQRVAGLGHGSVTPREAKELGIGYWVRGTVSESNLDLLARSAGLPRTIYHLAGGSSVSASIESPLEDFERTVTSTAHLLDWYRQAQCDAKIVCVSSAAVYGSGHDGPIPEDAPARPASPYGAHKYAMEQLCWSSANSFGIPIVIVRLFSVFGVELRRQLVWDLASRIAAEPKRIELSGSGDERRDWLSVKAAVVLLHRLSSAASPATPVFNGGTGIATSVREMARTLIDAWGSDVELRFSGDSRPGDPHSLVADVSRLDELGVTPVESLRAELHELIATLKPYLSS